jgi:hypothetical protein
MFEKYTGKCGMQLKENNNTFINSCKHRFLGDCFKRFYCPCKIEKNSLNNDNKELKK